MYARLVIGDFMMVIHFLACYEQRQHFRELRATWACGKVRTSSVQALKNKKLLLRGRLWRRPSPANSRADTTKFRKRLNTWNVEKLRRNSLCLAISEIPHQY